MGLNFCFLLIGGTPFQKSKEEFPTITAGKRKFSVERFTVGVATIAFGFGLTVAWIYFMILGWDSFITQASILLPHVLTQLFAGIALFTAGLGIFRQWRRSNGIFWTAMGLLLLSLVLAFLLYGPRGHGEPTFMYLFGAWIFVIGGFFTTAVFLLDRIKNDTLEKKVSPIHKTHKREKYRDKSIEL